MQGVLIHARGALGPLLHWSPEIDQSNLHQISTDVRLFSFSFILWQEMRVQ